jgi:hypothetical protein
MLGVGNELPGLYTPASGAFGHPFICNFIFYDVVFKLSK